MSNSELSIKRQLGAICDEFEQQWSGEKRPDFQAFAKRMEIKNRARLLRMLIEIDVDFRQKARQTVHAEDYQAVARDAPAIVEELLNNGPPTRSLPDGDQTQDFKVDPTNSLETLAPDSNKLDSDKSASEIPKSIGRYQVGGVLGQGGFGLVYKAYDDQLQRHVAVKVPHARLVKRPEDAEVYLTEARTVANLEHSRIVPVYDVGQSDEHPCFIVSRYIEGTDLSDRLKQQPFSILDTVELIAKVAEALHYAHKQGLVHRDVKPGNILLAKDGQPFVVDFGLALKEQNVGKGAEYAGTPAYMSPEQARGEGHRVDGRSDIYSLGVVLYEMLVGKRTFSAGTTNELFQKISSLDVKPLRQINDSVPRELERICLKALSRRASDRYTAALDMADDLRHFLQGEATESLHQAGLLAAAAPGSDSTKAGVDSQTPKFDSESRAVRVVPKGLRSFDAHDADFFLELLPGPRDRDGLPDSIRFWKTRIEETDPDHTFSIGLIYGPSGCGKSSLMKAGLIPRVSDDVIPVYLEATPDETESRLLHGLRKSCPGLEQGLTLKNSLVSLRQGDGLPRGKKVIVVLDQFEQWLHAMMDQPDPELIQALRQCDGAHLQCIVMVRDDFWLAVSRFLRELEVRLVEGENSALTDLFDLDHARKVLAAFGRAFGKLPEITKETSGEQKEFINQAAIGLSEESKVICVRLALFAEMMKGRPWTPASLAEVGGTSGVGVTFLDETFSASTAPPEHRFHQKSARAVLNALLPDSGTDIKGEMKPYDELLDASGYRNRPKEFDDLIRILDSEIRLITPTDPEGMSNDDDSISTVQVGKKYYQLTHDYLVHSLRDWLTRKQRETRRGRAELLLAERSVTWNAKSENRQLPSTLEWLRIRALTPRANWTLPQRKMMQRASRMKGMFWSGVLALLVLTGIGVQQMVSQIEQRTALRSTDVAVDSLQGAEGNAVPFALDKLSELPRDLVVLELQGRIPTALGQQRLSLFYGMARFDQVDLDTIIAGLTNEETDPKEVDNLVEALRSNEPASLAGIRSAATEASNEKQWATKARLAIAALHMGDASLAAEMLRDQPKEKEATVQLTDLLAEFRMQIDQVASLSDERRKSLESRLKLAIASYFLDQDEEALVELEKLSNSDAANWEIWLRQAICQARVGREEDAKKSLDELSKVTSMQSLVAYAEILVEASVGNLEAASEQLDELIESDSDNATSQYNAACIAAQLVRVCRAKQLPQENKYRQLALLLLKAAYVRLGYDDQGSGLDSDPDFIPLHDDPDFQALVAELKSPAQIWDPIQRTVFIREFSQWSGKLEPLAKTVAGSDYPSFRSGLCLAVGGVEKPRQAAKETWQPVLQRWHAQSTDNGTHSASRWALAQWKLDLPEIAETKTPPDDRDWWRAAGVAFVRISTGKVSGEDGPIAVDQEYWLSDCEITVGQFKQFIADAEYHRQHSDMKPVDWDGAQVFGNNDSPNLPVQQVSWYDAVMFCNWFSWKQGLETCYEIKKSVPVKREIGAQQQDQKGVPTAERQEPFDVTWKRGANGIRLPTEGEWEYACRASTTTAFSFGDDESELLDYCWFGLNSNSRTHPTGSKCCNAWGLFDMHGNVYEWCWDSIGSGQVCLGGSWRGTAWGCRSSDEDRGGATDRISFLGFRVARSPSSQNSQESKQSEIITKRGNEVANAAKWNPAELSELEKWSKLLREGYPNEVDPTAKTRVKMFDNDPVCSQ